MAILSTEGSLHCTSTLDLAQKDHFTVVSTLDCAVVFEFKIAIRLADLHFIKKSLNEFWLEIR